MKPAGLQTLAIVGGGYDHLASLTRAGARRLQDARLIICPERLFPPILRSVNPEAETVSYAVGADPLSVLEGLERVPPLTAVLLEGGILDIERRRRLDVLAGAGVAWDYHPTVPLTETACRRAGQEIGGRLLATLPAGAAAEGRIPVLPGSGEVDVVCFDGRVLWPARRLQPEGIPAMAALLPPGGRVFLIRPGGTRYGLAGRGVLVTRSLEQADDLGLLLSARGATPFYLPTIRIAGPGDDAELEEAVRGLERYDAVILTSANAVDRFMERLETAGLDARALAGRRLMAVGSKTARALEARGLRADDIPADFRAEGLVALLEEQGVRGRRFLYPRAEEAREVLPERIRTLGGEVDVVTFYRTVRGEGDPEELGRLRKAGVIDAVTFTSGSTVTHFMGLAGELGKEILDSCTVACIGPVTAKAVTDAGHEVTVMPATSTVEDLVAALAEHYSTGRA